LPGGTDRPSRTGRSTRMKDRSSRPRWSILDNRGVQEGHLSGCQPVEPGQGGHLRPRQPDFRTDWPALGGSEDFLIHLDEGPAVIEVGRGRLVLFCRLWRRQRNDLGAPAALHDGRAPFRGRVARAFGCRRNVRRRARRAERMGCLPGAATRSARGWTPRAEPASRAAKPHFLRRRSDLTTGGTPFDL
jgi:hypothetical protein